MVCQRELEVELLHATQHLDPLRFLFLWWSLAAKIIEKALRAAGPGSALPSRASSHA